MARPRNRWLLAAAVGGVLLGGTALALVLQKEPPEVVEARESEVTQLVRQAREEAALHYYVYPPADEPDRPTAYSVIRKLEEMGDEGEEQAIALRAEFANTLVRLGDQYWDAEGGKAFAIDYYAQALMFEPDNPRASERGTLTPGQLAALEDKAAKGDFTEIELAAAEPLAVLAEEDETRREEKLEKLGERGEMRSASTDAQLEKLVGKKIQKRKRRRPRSRPDTADASPSGASSDQQDAEDKGTGKSSGSKAKRDSAGAKELAGQGTKALRSGNRSEARSLFQKALAKDRRNGEALIGLSDVYFSSGNYPKAVRYAERAVTADKKNANYQVKLGDAYYKVMRYDAARKAYERARALGSSRAQRRIDRVDRKLGN